MKTQGIENWEIEFDEEMMLASFGFGEANVNRLKDLIRKTLASERARIKEIVEGKKKEHCKHENMGISAISKVEVCKDCGDPLQSWHQDTTMGWNAALSAVLKEME